MKMKTLMIGFGLTLLSVLGFVSLAVSALDPASADEFKARIVNLNAAAQAQVAELDAQVQATTDDAARANLEEQLREAKFQAEAQRLQILLEWAQAEGDEARVAEVQTALDRWLNPPQPQQLPQVEREIPAPSTSSSTEASH